MELTINNSSISKSTIIWAIVASILLHLLLAVAIPNFNFDAIKKAPDQLIIEIVQPKTPEPVVIPEPPAPVEQAKPEPIKPLQKKLPQPEAAPINALSPEPVQTESPPPTVITAAPKVDAPPVITVPTPAPTPAPQPEPPKKTEPSEDDVNAALRQYGGTLGRAIAKHKQYPKIAQMRGWQGECLLDLKIDSSGNVLSASVKESSGFESLDNQALEMARKASPFPTPPDALKDRSFNITVPVSFKLE